MKAFKVIAGILVLSLIIGGGLFTPRPYTVTEFAMDTIITITTYGTNRKEATEQVLQRIRELDEKLDPRDSQSQLARINAAEKDVPIPIDDDVLYILTQAQQFSRRSEGVFDITLLPVSKLWGFGTSHANVPDTDAISDALSHVGTNLVQIDEASKTITKSDSLTKLDLGAAAKGFAADEAIRILKENGIKSAYLDLGGNIAVLGKKPLGLWEALKNRSFSKPFTIGIQKPGAPRGDVIETLSLSDCFIVTSGDYERCFEDNGTLYHHILNPETGFPAQSGSKSVTVVAQNGLMADMLSTTLFITGKKAATDYADFYDALIFVDEHLQTTHIP